MKMFLKFNCNLFFFNFNFEKINLLSNKLFSDIRFWILIFFAIRLFGITNPPLEIAHNWRQTTVTMVARNFYETKTNIFYLYIWR